MSMFNGIVQELGDVRVDYFSTTAGAKPPRAHFLSHIHSDHLQGLDNDYTCPFIYCSAATREILLRLQTRAQRINFARGVIEQQEWWFNRLGSVVKALPLDAPVTIELAWGREIRVTLLDANHCAGA